MNKEKFTLIGAGLAGPLLASYLAKRGYSVEMFERRQDMRKESISAGRSINLALSIRGNHALKEVGLYDKIKHNAIPMKGRMIHELNGSIHLQPYGQKENEVIFSVSRAHLNMELMTLAEETGNVIIRFNHELLSADLEQNKLLFQLPDSLEKIELPPKGWIFYCHRKSLGSKGGTYTKKSYDCVNLLAFIFSNIFKI